MTTHIAQSETPGTFEAFLRQHGVTMTYEQVATPKDREPEQTTYKVTLKRPGRDGEPVLVWYEFLYGFGNLCPQEGVETSDFIESVMEALKFDMGMVAECDSLEEYLVNYTDIGDSPSYGHRDERLSKKERIAQAIRTWNACMEVSTKLEALFGAVGLYDFKELKTREEMEEGGDGHEDEDEEEATE